MKIGVRKVGKIYRCHIQPFQIVHKTGWGCYLSALACIIAFHVHYTDMNGDYYGINYERSKGLVLATFILFFGTIIDQNFFLVALSISYSSSLTTVMSYTLFVKSE